MMIPARKVGKENWQAFRTALLDNRSNLAARRYSLALRHTPIIYVSIIATASTDMRVEMPPATGSASGDWADAIPLVFCLEPKAGARTGARRLWHGMPDVAGR
jgi:hypothetical protein